MQKTLQEHGCQVAMDIGTIEVYLLGLTMDIIPVQQPIKARPNILRPIIQVGMQWAEYGVYVR